MLYEENRDSRPLLKAKEIEKKNVFRRNFNGRVIKYRLLLILLSPKFLKRLFNFYPDTHLYEEVATKQRVHRFEIETVKYGLSEDDLEFASSCREDIPPVINVTHGFYEIEEPVMLHGTTGQSVLLKTTKQVHHIPGRARFTTARPASLREVGVPKADKVYNLLGVHKGHAHFFHAIANYLQPLWQYLEYEYDPEDSLLIVHRPDAPVHLMYHLNYVQAAYPKVQLFALGAKEKCVVRNTCYATREVKGRIYSRLMEDGFLDFLNRSANHEVNQVDPPAGLSKRLFLSRRDTKLRQILNQKDVDPLLEKHGIETFCPVDYSYAEQVAIFAHADLIVTVHGAGLVNVAFCKPGARIIEITPADYRKMTFPWIGYARGLKYDFVVGGLSDYHQSFEVDVKLVEQALDAASEDIPMR